MINYVLCSYFKDCCIDLGLLREFSNCYEKTVEAAAEDISYNTNRVTLAVIHQGESQRKCQIHLSIKTVLSRLLFPRSATSNDQWIEEETEEQC